MPGFLPLAIIAGAFAFILLALRVYHAWLLHRERLAALDNGVSLKPILLQATPAFGHRAYLLRGLVWLLVGTAVSAFLGLAAPLFQTQPRDTREQLEYRQIRVRSMRALGATPEQIEAMEKEMAQAEAGHRAPLNPALIGVIPIAVGLAYLVFYGIEERRLRRPPPAP